jgi:GxxExxY protein
MGYTKKDDPLTYAIIGCCHTVHRNLGPGFEEVIYQRALALELQAAGLDFAREEWITVHYKDTEIGKKRVDFLVSDCLVEIKACSKLEPVHFMQTFSYVKASGCRVGLLVNFGGSSVEVERISGRKDGG